jgi:hypothetical protein
LYIAHLLKNGHAKTATFLTKTAKGGEWGIKNLKGKIKNEGSFKVQVFSGECAGWGF